MAEPQKPFVCMCGKAHPKPDTRAALEALAKAAIEFLKDQARTPVK